MVEHGSPPWHVYIKLATTIFWVLLHAVRASGRSAVARKTVKKKG